MIVDTTVLVAAQRYSGNDVHRIAGLSQTYVDACFLDDLQLSPQSRVLAEESKHRLYRALLEKTA